MDKIKLIVFLHWSWCPTQDRNIQGEKERVAGHLSALHQPHLGWSLLLKVKVLTAAWGTASLREVQEK